MTGRIIASTGAGLLTGLLLSAVVVRGDMPESAATRAPSAAKRQIAQMTAVLDARRNTIETLETARAAAEADLREAIRQQPIDEALVRSLVAEIVNFGLQLVDDDERVRSEMNRILDQHSN